MRITENRALAAAVCVICALVSIFGIGGMKLKGEYDDVIYEFVDAGDERHNIEAYLDRCTGYADELANESMQYLDNDETAQAVLDYSDALNAKNGPGNDRYADFEALTDSVELLYSKLQEAGKADEPEIEIAYGDYKSACDLIKRDDYYEEAAVYNDMVSGFPAGMIASMWGVGSADSFGR